MKLYGIVGHPVDKSLSPFLHNAAIQHLGLEAEYQTFDIEPDNPENLAHFCYETDINQIAGFSVTMPYKQEVMMYMDHYDPAAKIIGSVNTVMNEDSLLIGYNTDVIGAIQAIKEKTDPAGKKALVMGAGGAARAVIYGLKSFGAEVYVYNRTLLKAEELAEQFEVDTIDYRLIHKGDFDIIVNATSVGSLPNTQESLLHAEQIPAQAVVMDIITSPIETQLLKQAKIAGAQTISGERMLLHQAVGQFELWFDQEAPIEVMKNALYKELNKRGRE